jgi:hypothetical protein
VSRQGSGRIIAREECQPGYRIRLAVDNVVYEYNARMLGKQTILWHEVETGQPLSGEESWEGHYASSVAANEK